MGLGKAVEALEGVEAKVGTGQVALQLILALEGLVAVAAREPSHNAGQIAKYSRKKSEFLGCHCCLKHLKTHTQKTRQPKTRGKPDLPLG